MKAFGNYKNKKKRLQSNVFWYLKVHTFWKFIRSLHIEIKHKFLKRFPLYKIGFSISDFISFLSKFIFFVQ